eukprot:SAG31_NODE_1069_length_10077_cov_2.403588_4_plen_146_part_00
MVLSKKDFASAWAALDSGSADSDNRIELVAVGNPHLSLNECAELAELVRSSPVPKSSDVSFVATMGREVHAAAKDAGHIEVLEDFGVGFVTDTCWCMLTEPVVPVTSRTLITNSAKYAHYAPGANDFLLRNWCFFHYILCLNMSR